MGQNSFCLVFVPKKLQKDTIALVLIFLFELVENTNTSVTKWSETRQRKEF